jgi:hypothetical protein
MSVARIQVQLDTNSKSQKPATGRQSNINQTWYFKLFVAQLVLLSFSLCIFTGVGHFFAIFSVGRIE